MIGSTIAKRYAKAFFETAAEENRVEAFYDEMLSFSAILAESADLRGFLANPVFETAEKRSVIDALLAKASLSGTTANAMKLLADKGRMVILPDICNCYRDMMDEALGRVRVSVRTALPLSPATTDRLQKGLEAQTGKNVSLTVTEEPSLLGGIVVQVGDTVYDSCVRTQLNNLRNLLGEEK